MSEANEPSPPMPPVWAPSRMRLTSGMPPPELVDSVEPWIVETEEQELPSAEELWTQPRQEEDQ
jgi:hypothetical protein